MQAEQQSELLPCPFCGHVGLDFSEGSTFRWIVASCSGCGASIGETRIQTLGQGTKEEWMADAQQDAIDAWNRRAAHDSADQHNERERFEAWAVAILGDRHTWRESGPCELAWQAWQARAALSQPTPQWMPIESAPKDGTEILACWPKRKLDDDECPTGEIVGYARCVTVWQGFWIEPDYLEAHGSFYFEDEAFAAEPTYWQPLPSAPLPVQERGE